MKITFITGNLGKVQNTSRYLGFEIDHRAIELEEIQSLDVEEVVEDKARRAFKEVQEPVLIEDVSFVFHSLGKLPGPFIKWFEKELGNEGLCRLLDGKDRKCTATVCYGYCDGTNVKFFEGSMSGSIAESPRGENSFGWGSVFIPEGYDKTFAELSDEEQDPLSMRNKALEKFREYIENKEGL